MIYIHVLAQRLPKDSGLLRNATSGEQLLTFWRIIVASSSGSSSPRRCTMSLYTNARTWNLTSV